MKIHEENALIHKIHYWASLTINYSSSVIAIVILKKEYDNLPTILVSVFALVLFAAMYIDRDMCKKDTSYSSIIFKYICVFLLSGLFVYKAYEKTSLTVAIILSSLIVFEILIAFTINHRYIIRNKFKQMIKRCKTK